MFFRSLKSCLPPTGGRQNCGNYGCFGPVQFIKEVGFFDAIFERDAVQVISEINSGPPYLSRLGHFLESIHMEKQFLRLCTFSFMSRDANFIAHCLAKETACNKTDMCWLEDIPQSIFSIVLKEAVCSLDP
jgi:hypothetical protein